MDNKILFLLFIILHSISILLFEDLILLGEFYFYSLLLFLLSNFFITKRLNLIQAWAFSFLFVILSEVFTSSNLINSSENLKALQFLLIANNSVILGYLLTSSKDILLKVKTKKIVRGREYAILTIIITMAGYVIFTVPIAILAFSSGRIAVFEQSTEIMGQIIQSVALVFPAIITFYFLYVKQKKLLIPILLSLPIFISQFMLGSRFPLLFSFGGVFLVFYTFRKGKLSTKLILTLVSMAAILIISSSLIKSERGGYKSGFIKEKHVSALPAILSEFSSPEGVVYNTSQMMQYFENNEFLYGQSSSFILYFWVPRSLWPEKPTQLGHWLVRKYDSVSQFHSVSYGFPGELYSDFGFYSLFFMFIIGFLLKKGDDLKNLNFKKGGYSVIISAMLFPYIFFFVRSPITGSTTFLGILFFFFIFKRIIFKEVKVINFK